MERLALKELQTWFQKKKRKPLVIWGARQVGKTYLVRDLFAGRLGSDYVYIDLKQDADTRSFFAGTVNPADYLKYIEARFGKKVTHNTPLIFDETQVCHSVLTSLKYFKQDYPELPVIATGSMVRLSLLHDKTQESVTDDSFLFPVGGFHSLDLYPLGFEEYLINTNEVLLEMIRDAYREKKPLMSPYHEMALDALHTFLSVGGMPEALETFLETDSYVDTGEVITDIYRNYLSDMDTYNVSKETILKTRRVYQNIFSQLNKTNKNFKISQVEKGRANRDYFNAYQWLELSRVVYRSRHTSGKITLPFTEEREGLFRLYLADAGMFLYQSNVRQSDFFVKDKRNTLSGVFYESYVAGEFVMKGIPLFYWTGKTTNEMEFVVECEGRAIPVDVKKGRGKMNSLQAFRNVNPHSVAFKISADRFGYDREQDLYTVPLYQTFLLAKDLAAGEKGIMA